MGCRSHCQEAHRRFDARRSVAVILNTVRDACDVYRRTAAPGDSRWRFLAAAMLPGHKAKIIADVRRLLRRPKECVGVVCTQVLEAGVDLSFASLLRALPVFPSIVQAAGRANRHGAAKDAAEVVVFDYRREEGKQSRQYIYTSEHARATTDAILAAGALIAEQQVPDALDRYFRDLWAAEPATACLERFEKSARGAGPRSLVSPRSTAMTTGAWTCSFRTRMPTDSCFRAWPDYFIALPLMARRSCWVDSRIPPFADCWRTAEIASGCPHLCGNSRWPFQQNWRSACRLRPIWSGSAFWKIQAFTPIKPDWPTC